MKSKLEIINEMLDGTAKRRAIDMPSVDADPMDDELIVQVLQRRLPNVEMVTCEDLRDLQVECCEVCHTFDPEIELAVVPLLDCRVGWLCCAIKAAMTPDGSTEPNTVMDAWLQWGR